MNTYYIAKLHVSLPATFKYIFNSLNVNNDSTKPIWSQYNSLSLFACGFIKLYIFETAGLCRKPRKHNTASKNIIIDIYIKYIQQKQIQIHISTYKIHAHTSIHTSTPLHTHRPIQPYLKKHLAQGQVKLI